MTKEISKNRSQRVGREGGRKEITDGDGRLDARESIIVPFWPELGICLLSAHYQAYI